MYLLDTNVVSELRKPRPHGAVLAWLQSVADADLHVSAVTLGEIEAWLDQVGATCNVLPMDAVSFREWARLMHRGSDTLYEDAMIAATAISHALTIVTRNVGDFAQFGVPVLNPFEASAP
jgi:predicted nucleic acid-binding protein